MVNRLGANHNNPFYSGERPAVRNLHLKNDPAKVLARANNLRNKTERREGSFGDIVDAVIVGEEQNTADASFQAGTKSRYRPTPDPWDAIAAKMRFQTRVNSADIPKQSQQEQIDQLAAEVKSLRSDLNRLMSKNQSPRINRPINSNVDLRRHHPRQPNSFNLGLGHGYEIGNA